MRMGERSEGDEIDLRSIEDHLAPIDDDADALYEEAPCGYLSTAPDGTFLRVNRTFLAMTGYDRHDLVGGRRFSDLLTGGGRIYHETHYAPMLQMQGSARAIALDLVRVDGSRLPVLVNSVLERDASGEAVVVRTAVFDASERRSYERALLAAKKQAEEAEAEAVALARTLQQVLIPPEPPAIDGLEVACRYRPAGVGDVVGGDFYDVFEAAPDEWVVVVGDVCGKGPHAAVVTALARRTIREAVVRHRHPSDVLCRLNDALLRNDANRFCTVAMMRLRLDPQGWAATVAVGGHPLPLLRQGGGPPVTLGRPGTLLGVFDDPEIHDDDVVLRPGDLVVLYTDGATEGRRGDDFYGDERLVEAVGGLDGSPDQLLDRTLDELLAFQDHHPSDDIVLVAVGVPGAPGMAERSRG
jgi:sigma-B regulation protein RsbU (phosphoserine phosphatase)